MSVWSKACSVSGGKNVWKNYIAGKWVSSSNRSTIDVLDPSNGKLIGKVPKSTMDDAERAINSAWNNRTVIASIPAIERMEMLGRLAELMEKYKQDFIDVIIKEAGKPLSVVQGEVNASIERLKFSIEEVKSFRGEYIPGDIVPDTKGKFAIVKKIPRGVVLAIGPFNYPLFIPTSKIAPALASGNSVVFKAASDDPICMIMFARLAELAGVPPGVFNVITGSGSEIGDFMVSHPRVGMISFTGSSEAGKHIASVAGMKRLHLELGGKCPGIVFEDCDIDLAVKECAKGSLKYSGQRCDSLSKIIVHSKIYTQFVSKMKLEVKNWKTGPTTSSKTSIGPLINQKSAERVEGYIKDAVKKGAVLVAGGKRHGLYIQPTILKDVDPRMTIFQEETFGPVVSIVKFRTFDEAIKISNNTNYGLDASVFTQDVNKAVKAANLIEAGSVTINGAPSHGLGNFPFGGDKDSGIGREGMNYTIDEMTKLHTIVFSHIK